MIIQVRGTSGSGKSTAVRSFMEGLEWQRETVTGRKKPLYYRSLNAPPRLAVIGHYESPCGGGDTIGSAKAIYDLTMSLLPQFDVIIQEGLLLSEDTKWSSLLPDLRVIFLVTSLDQCLEWIGKRREAAGNSKPLNPENTSNRVRVIDRARIKLTEAGVTVRQAAAGQVPSLISEWVRKCKTNRLG